MESQCTFCTVTTTTALPIPTASCWFVFAMRCSILIATLFCATSFSLMPVFAQKPLRTFAVSESTADERHRLKELWQTADIFEAPATFEAPDQIKHALHANDGRIYPIFFEGVPYRGMPTRVFAWVGIPAGASAEHPAPGIVLVHGGGGTAYRDWVHTWIKRGYTAIAIDTEGAAPHYRPGGSFTPNTHADAGPASAGGGFTRSSEPVQEQWPYHAVAAIIAAHSVLRNLPETNAERTGITGISWGSVLSSIAASVDDRFRFAVLVYGCGYIGINSYRQPNVFQQLPPQTVQRWMDLWDPSGYLGAAVIPNLLFINGTNDAYFPTDSWDKSVRLAQSNPNVAVTRTLRIAMPHGHPPAGDPPEVLAYANAVLNNSPVFATVTDSGTDGHQAWVHWQQNEHYPVRSARLVYTQDDGKWEKRQWETREALIHKDHVTRLSSPAITRADAKIPPHATAFYFNLENAAGSIVSSPLMGPDAPKTEAQNQQTAE